MIEARDARRAGTFWRGAHISRLWLKASPWLFTTTFIVLFFWTNSRQYATFDLQAPDVPRFSQAIWNTLHGRFLYSSIIDDFILSFHFSPFLALLPMLFGAVALALLLNGSYNGERLPFDTGEESIRLLEAVIEQ